MVMTFFIPVRFFIAFGHDCIFWAEPPFPSLSKKRRMFMSTLKIFTLAIANMTFSTISPWPFQSWSSMYNRISMIMMLLEWRYVQLGNASKNMRTYSQVHIAWGTNKLTVYHQLFVGNSYELHLVEPSVALYTHHPTMCYSTLDGANMMKRRKKH